MNQYRNINTGKILVLVASAFTFAYCFGVFIHEIGHILGYQYYGIATKKLVLDPFGHSYMLPLKENPAGDLLQFSGGSLLNIISACLVASLFCKNHNMFAFPLLMWAGVAFIQESIAIVLDLVNGSTFDWTLVVAAGMPIYLVIIFSLLCMGAGCTIFLRLLAIVGINPDDSYTKILTICILGISPFFIISLIYVLFFMVTDQDNWILSKSISLGASIILSVVLALLFKPLYPMLEKFLPVKSRDIKPTHLGSSLSIAVLFTLFCLFFFN